MPAPEARRCNTVVCLGCSAGGLQALEAFVGSIDKSLAACFLILMHHAPEHKSLLPELLAKHTDLPVAEAEDGSQLVAQQILVLPAHSAWHLEGGILRSGGRVSLPIDHLFCSLAKEMKERGVAVVLSGTGSDGSRGVKDIKEQGGLVLVQDQSAQYDGMPKSALGTNAVDYALPPERMCQQIGVWLAKMGILGEEAPAQVPAAAPDLKRIIYLLRQHSGHDFSLYKKNTILRRLERRLVAQGLDSLGDYVRFLEGHKEERERLLQEILIGVTSFFRDPEAFDVLKERVIPHLRRHVSPNGNLRIWTAGCSSGEEAYSVAMAVQEAAQEAQVSGETRIFSSDIDKLAIETAREGRYPKAIAAEVGPERLRQFFTEGLSSYMVKKEMKERIIFAHHDVLRDPPFSKLDLISCRNLMIYLEPALQQRLLRIFHYALNPGGILFLGSSEAIGEASGLFATFDKKWKFFERKSTVATNFRELEFDLHPTPLASAHDQHAALPQRAKKPSVGKISQEVLLSLFVPPSVVCDEAGSIFYIHGRVADYLEPAGGEARLNVFAMCKEEIKLELSRGMQKALASGETVRYTGLKIKKEASVLEFDLTLRMLDGTAFQQALVLISFETTTAKVIKPEIEVLIDTSTVDERARDRERELLYIKEHMQNLVEQLENSNEELKSMNEELQSSNEELQSSNEELETAKEELQAVNEELGCLNSELHAKIDELFSANSDLDNFLSSSSVATIFINRNFTITRYSRSTTKIFHLIPSDVGRSLGDIATQLKYDRVLEDASEALHELTTVERTVEAKNGLYLFMRITPYKTADNVIDGVVISFSDITEQRQLESRLSVLRDLAENYPSPVLVFNASMQIVFGNRQVRELVGLKSDSLLTGSLGDLRLVPGPGVEQSWQAEDFSSWRGSIELHKPHQVQSLTVEVVNLGGDSALRCMSFQNRIEGEPC